ncbi:hypothetical protein FIV42_28615 [Persicimonas caeni]|uniref:Sulfotransferase family protein n=1 Tax=Persicimonas caeni TaxID=2292766 RepID=A0A4Y6Q1V6_PERCE|nr:sulfotransferase family 2 domain-containing protein [Persicimonas caeni]QDG54564.1 hypothetical protein FIV42_28615 [Persicimonas caeni]QED35785.1 hypothetical protein FRD00_28610 [Persicimonas caeni]
MPTKTDLQATVANVGSFIRQSVTRPVEDRIFFVHLPKCGGKSIDKAIRRVVRAVPGRRRGRIVSLDEPATTRAADAMGVSVWDVRDHLQAFYLSQDDVHYLRGHFQVREDLMERYAGEFAFVTVMREPVKRWISHYFFNRYKKDDHFRIEIGLEEFVETERARDLGQMYLRYFSGTGQVEGSVGEDKDVRDRARRNLERFELVGFLGELDDFRAKFEKRFGADLTTFKRNKNPAPKAALREELTPELRARIEELCEPDIELYEHARARYA